MTKWRKELSLLLVGMMIMSGLVAFSAPAFADENLGGSASIVAEWNDAWMINHPGIAAADEQIVMNYDNTNAKMYYLGDDEAIVQIPFTNGNTDIDIDTTVTFTISVGAGNTLISIGERSTHTLNPPVAGATPWVQSTTVNAWFTIDIGNSGIVEQTYPMRIGAQYTLAGATETRFLDFEVYVASRLHPAGTNLARDTKHELTMDSGDYIMDNEDDAAFEAGDKFKEAVFELVNRGPDAITNPEITLTAPAGFTLVRPSAKFVGEIASADSEDFLWRVDVAPRTAPGIYQGTALLTYQRTVVGVEKTITETARPIDYTVDYNFKDTDPYTPGADTLWSEFQIYATDVVLVSDNSSRQIDYTAPYDIPTIEQDTYTDRMITVDVTIVNNGNSDLYNLELEVDPTYGGAWDYFRNPRFFWTAAAGLDYDTITDTFDLAIGEEATFTISMIVMREIPIGEHRLPILYRGYYFDDGSLGGSTGFMETNGGDDLEIIFSLMVVDTMPDFYVTWAGTGADDKQDITANWFEVQILNMEEYNFIHATVQADFTGTPWYNPIIGMRDPMVWADEARPTNTLNFWAADDTEWFTFVVDTDPSFVPDRYPFLLTITAVIEETLEVVTVTLDYTYGAVIDFGGYGPKLQISAFTTTDIVPGKTFDMVLTIQNVGDDTLRDISVIIGTDHTEEYNWDLIDDFLWNFDWTEVYENWMDVAGPIQIPDGMFYTLEDLDVDNVREIVEINLYMDGVYSTPGARISLVRINNLAPGATIEVEYTMLVDKDFVNGKPYEIPVSVMGIDSEGDPYSETLWISVMSSLPGKSYNPVELNWFDAGLKALGLFLFFIIVLAILLFVYNMFKGEPYDDEDDFDFEDDEPLEPAPMEPAPAPEAAAPEQELVEP